MLWALPLGAQPIADEPLHEGSEPALAPRLVAFAPVSEPAWTLRAALAALHDSNVARAPHPQGDRAWQGALGVQLDRRLGLQRLRLEAQATAWRYDRLPAWDHTLTDYQAQWAFGLTPQVSGLLAAVQRQARDLSLVDGGRAQVDLATDREQSAVVRWAPGGPWRVEAGGAQHRRRSEATAALEANARLRRVQLGLGYRLPAGVDLLGQVQRAQGQYPDSDAPRFQDMQLESVLQGPLATDGTWAIRLGQRQRRHDAQAARDFRGTVGQWEVHAPLGGHTRLDAGLERLLGAYDTGAGGAVRLTRAYIAPGWQVGPRTRLTLRHEQVRGVWSTVDPAAPDAGRDDRLRRTALTLDWQPWRTWQWLAQVQTEARASTLAGARFHAMVSSLTARLQW